VGSEDSPWRLFSSEVWLPNGNITAMKSLVGTDTVAISTEYGFGMIDTSINFNL